MRNAWRGWGVACALSLFLVLGACARPLGGESPPTRFYLLSAAPAPMATSAGAAMGAVVGVAPAALADHLKRPQVVSRIADNRVDVAEFDRWAAPLDQQVQSLVAENLAILLPTDRVTLLPTSRVVPLDHRVEVEIPTFERRSDGAVVLVARWRLIAEPDGVLHAMRRSVYVREGVGPGFGDLAAAMSGALADLSREIAAAIRGDLPALSPGTAGDPSSLALSRP